MATNFILPFAGTDTGTNLLTQEEYEADAQRIIGHQPGVARSKLENKALRQATAMASGLAQFIADNAELDVSDEMTAADIAAAIDAALAASIEAKYSSEGGSWWQMLPGKIIMQFGSTFVGKAGSPTRTTFPVAYVSEPKVYLSDVGNASVNTVQQQTTTYFTAEGGFVSDTNLVNWVSIGR